MLLKFNNGEQIQLSLNESWVSNAYKKAYKHLQHVDILWYDIDNPYNNKDHSDTFVELGNKLGLQINDKLVNQKDQDYFNYLHTFVVNRKGSEVGEWFYFHRMLHSLEEDVEYRSRSRMRIKYNHKAWPLVIEYPKDFDYKKQVTKVTAGDIFVPWTELGKSPYRYWSDKEPDNLDSVLTLSKPRTEIRFNCDIALDDLNLMPDDDFTDYITWWNKYEDAWCKYHNVSEWNLEYNFGVIHIGHTNEVDKIKDLLMNGAKPTRIVP